MAELIGLVASCKTISSALVGMSAFLIDVKRAPKSAKELFSTLDRKKRVLDNLLTSICSMSPSPDDLRLIRDSLRFLEMSFRCLYAQIAPLVQCNWSRKKIMKIEFKDLSHTFKTFMKRTTARCRWAAFSSVRQEKMKEIRDALNDILIVHGYLVK